MLENIVDSSVNRRDFLRLIAASSVFGCGKKKITGGNGGPGKGNDSSNDNGSDEFEEDPSGDYTQFAVADYSLQSAIVERGFTGIKFTNQYSRGGEEIYPVEIDQFGNSKTIGEGGVVVTLYEDDLESIVYAYDSQDRYLPGFLVTPQNEVGKAAGIREVALYLKDKANKALHFGRNVVIKEIEEASPQWNEEHVANIRGIRYYGDWSFNQTRNLNTLLNETSTVFSFTGLGAVISAATTTAGYLFDVADEVIDLVNQHTPFNIDKDKRFGVYGLSRGALILVPAELVSRYKNRNPQINVLDYFPAVSGNSWNYNSSIYGDVESTVSVRNVNGKKVIVSRSSIGISAFYGFKDGELKLMGADYWDPDLGEAYLEPGVVLGTDNMNIGNTFRTKSRVRYAEIPELDVKVDELIELQGREHVSVPAGEFGDCLKIKETVRFYGKNKEDGRVIDSTDVSYSWTARNVGSVKSRIVGGGLLRPGTSELQSAVINGVSIPKPASYNEIRPLVLNVIEEAYKKFV